MSLGETAKATVDAFKTSPLLLLVVVLNAGMIFTLIYVANAQKDERQILTKMLIEASTSAQNCQPK